MEYRRLGQTDMQVSALGFGGAEIGFTPGVTQGQVTALVGAAIDAGLNVIDTAAAYQSSEAMLGVALAGRRQNVFLFTKCGATDGFTRYDWSEAGVLEHIAESLRRLRTDYLDLVQLHSCDAETLRRGECIAGLHKARERGMTRGIGYSGDGEAAKVAVELGVFDTLQTSVSIADQEAIDLTLPLARERRMGVIAKRPIANAAWRMGRRPENPYHHAYWERLQKLDYDFLKWDADAAVGHALRFTLSPPGDAEAVAALVEATRSGDSELRRAAALALGALGSAALPGVAPLARLTGDPNGEVRQAAVTALGRLGGYAAPALPTLRALATGDDAALRGTAAAAVKRIEGELARPVQPTPSASVLAPTPAAGRVEAPPAVLPPKPPEAPPVQPTPERVEAATTNAGGGVTAGAPTTRTGVVILAQDKPRYTPEAAAQHLAGVVVVRVEFRADGRIDEVKLVLGLGGGLDQEALRAARSIRFTPAQENGCPVTTTMDIKYRFVRQ